MGGSDYFLKYYESNLILVFGSDIGFEFHCAGGVVAWCIGWKMGYLSVLKNNGHGSCEKITTKYDLWVFNFVIL